MKRLLQHLLRGNAHPSTDSETADPVQKRTVLMHDPAYSFLKSDHLNRRLQSALAGIAAEFMPTVLSDAAAADYDKLVREFRNLLDQRPVSNNAGGAGFHNLFWLFMTAKLLHPRLAVESGVWKGQTTWLLSTLLPDAEIHAFDLTLGRLEVSLPTVSFHEHDWATHEFGSVNPDESFVFFDCHVSHRQRIEEARAKGFKWIAVDDNCPSIQLHAYGAPPLPTVEMLLHEGCRAGESCEWVFSDQELTWTPTSQDAAFDPGVVRNDWLFPDVGELTRYGGYRRLTLLELNTDERV